ncbi:MAG: Do family serine endopeptidase [Thermodesulfobacteriota bacterium]
MRSHVRCQSKAPIFLSLVLLMVICTLALPTFSQAAENPKSYDLSTAIIQVAKKNIPAVVHIEVTERQEVVNPMLPFESDPFFRHFFNIPKMPKKFKRELKGLGSGMIMDPKGYILTNHHVVGGATKIEVILSDGRRFPGKLIGTDPKTDLAVIHISARDPLPHVVFGDSDKVEVGEWVVAIGHPRGLDQTVTQGIISAKHRRGITDPNSYQDFLQTDAAINPGNSGGPLLNLKGEVIGVNAVIVSESGGFEGIGFTIPSDIALYVAKALIAHGKVERGWLGVSIRDLSPDEAKTFRAEGEKGALIAEIIKGGPAEKGGLRKNDLIILYNGKKIPDASSLRNEVASTPIGQEAKVTFLRESKRFEATVKIGNLESSVKVLTASIKDRIGAEVRPPTQKETEKYGLDPNQGVVIAGLDNKGPLKKAGFEVGDMILAVNKQPVEGVDGFIQLIGALKPNERVSLLALDHRSGEVGTIVFIPTR